MLALILTFGLLIAHSTTLTYAAAISGRGNFLSSPSREDLETLGVEMSPPLDNLMDYAYLQRRLWDISRKMNSYGPHKRFFCNPWGCV